MVRADPQADQQVEIGRGDTIGGGGADDLVEFLERIEAEGFHIVGEIGLGNRFLGFDRVHEAQFRPRQRPGHQPHFAQ